MKHVHTFGCPVFALQNALASGNQLPRWSPHAHLGTNLGPSPMHARNVYLVLNLITGCVSPQYHCCFDDFFETTRHGGPDVFGTICWQQLAGLDQVTTIFSEVSAPIQRSIMYPETPSEDAISLEEISVVPPFHEFAADNQASQTEIPKSRRMRDHLISPGLLIKMRESQALSLLSQPVLVNVGGFAQCHKEWLSQSPKVYTTWHINLP
jgi:hypothetical protein